MNDESRPQENRQRSHPRISIRCHVSGGGPVPFYGTPYSSGCDIAVAISQPVNVRPMERALLPTGIRLEIPAGYEAQIRLRSGKSLNGLILPNAPATIDADYRGEIKLICANVGIEPILIQPGEKIAQLVFAPVVHANFIEVENEEDLLKSTRGGKGFGSTGF